MFTIISTSLKPDSNSRILAQTALESYRQRELPVQWIDLSQMNLPMCNAGDCYAHPDAGVCFQAIKASKAILLASPIYNYDVSSSAKNLIELTGQAWMNKVVGFLVAAGGSGSYMSVMGVANSLMLDFRVTVIPRFVYATGGCFAGGRLEDCDIRERVENLVSESIRYGNALQPEIL